MNTKESTALLMNTEESTALLMNTEESTTLLMNSSLCFRTPFLDPPTRTEVGEECAQSV